MYSFEQKASQMTVDPPNHVMSLADLMRRGEDDRVALGAPEGHPLCYAGLRRQMGYVGGALRTVGAARSDTVALILPNGSAMASAFLGIAAHSACAPLNAQFGREELQFYIDDLRPAAIVLPADADLPARDIALARRIPELELEVGEECCAGEFRFRGFPSNGDCERFAENVDDSAGGDVALILHTSGTTARPKMVPLSHRNLCASAAAVAATLQLTAADKCLNVMPLFHIHGLVGVLLSSMYAGGSVLCTRRFDPDQFPRWLTEHRPTWYSAVPTIHQAVLAIARQSNSCAAHCLRLIRSSSSALPPPVMAQLEATFGVPVIESYGMTEAAHQMASNPLPPAARKPGSVGLPAGPEVSIMDDEGRLLPAGTSGEIVIRGPNVTAGYVGNPEANRAAFQDGWFRTGDLGLFDENGYLFLSGRKKEMINRGGEKIAPREIDEALLQHDSVDQAIAFAVPHPTLGEDVAAAVVLRADQPTTERELRRHAFQRLAPFKVPSRIVIVDAIPKGSTGKPQRIGLHKLLDVQLRVEYVTPKNAVEQSVAAAFEDVLERGPVGATDNFFALGGDSLKGTRVIARLGSDFHVDLPTGSLFANPTPEELSLEITRRIAEDTEGLEELLQEIEGMSDAEARRHLR
ncbi:MAG: AMP-binding protein [Planctomycetota bacterium]